MVDEDVVEFRFVNGTEDVFIEDDHYLYVYSDAETFSLEHLQCNAYYPTSDSDDFIREDTAPVDVEYLKDLKHAPREITGKIIKTEFYRKMELSGLDEVCEQVDKARSCVNIESPTKNISQER